jgi:hypothetical protein
MSVDRSQTAGNAATGKAAEVQPTSGLRIPAVTDIDLGQLRQERLERLLR